MATAQPSSNLMTIAVDALDLEPSLRDDYLTRTCGRDVDLRRQVEQLLDAEQDAGSFLEIPAAVRFADKLVAPGPATYRGQHIGPYRVTRQLGSGGFSPNGLINTMSKTSRSRCCGIASVTTRRNTEFSPSARSSPAWSIAISPVSTMAAPPTMAGPIW